MKLNETEWQYSLIKTYKSLDELLCISDCSRTVNCKLISFNKFNYICKYYRYYLTDETTLIKSNGDFVFSYQTGKYTYKLQGKKHLSLSAGCKINSLILIDNLNLAFGCTNGTIQIWSTGSWSPILSIAHNYNSSVVSLANLGNEYLISGGFDRLIKIWSLRTGQLVKTLSQHKDQVKTLLILSNNNDIVSGSYDQTIKIWNSNDGTMKYSLNTLSSVLGLVQLKNGNIVSITYNGFIRILNPYTGNFILSIDTSPGQTSMYQLNNDDLAIGLAHSGGLKIYDSTTVQLKYTLLGHTEDINEIIQLQNNDLATCSYDDTVRIWDLNTKSLKYNLTLHTFDLWGLAELPNGYIISGGKDSKIIVTK